jgi:hypothetical protein
MIYTNKNSFDCAVSVISLFTFILFIVGCTNSDVVETEITKSKIEEEHPEVSDSLIYSLDQIHDEFNLVEFGSTFRNSDFFQLAPFSDEILGALCLEVKLPSSSLKEWICNNKKSIGKDDWFQVKPIGLIKSANTLLYLIGTHEQMSASGESYLDIWCLSSNDGETIANVTKIGDAEYYPYKESGEEDGAEYLIRTVEGKDLTIDFLKPDSIVTKQIKYTIRDGYDWRVDQNLEINDSVALPEIVQVFKDL